MLLKNIFRTLLIAIICVILFNCSKENTPELTVIVDVDSDGIADGVDNCISTPNTNQKDSDGDGIGDVCDDSDSDSIFDNIDNCIADANVDQLDTDVDGIGDVCDDDDDNDTILDINDNCPLTTNTNQADADNDGIGNVCDPSTNIRIICENGFAGEFPCNDYDLMSHITLNAMSASTGNDSWGWTDATTGKEYVLMGLDNGTAFIDISDPIYPIYLGKLPTATVNSGWRDIKVYGDYAFIVSEAADHGMQVFDLTKLRNVTNPPQTFTNDAHYTGFGNAHNVVINEEKAFVYAVGTNTFNGGPHFVDIQNPLSPLAAGGYNIDNYSHDAQVITYNGPDTDYTGKEIYVGSNITEIVIVDVTDKANPKSISKISYPNVATAHQGWFTENHQYFLAGDELDESNFGFNTRTIILDFTDLDNPSYKTSYLGTTGAIDHNGYVKGNLFYLANYNEGVRFIDISNIAGNVLTEIGFFDTIPNFSHPAFNGVWSVYPYFESENIVVSSVEGGLFIIRKSGT